MSCVTHTRLISISDEMNKVIQQLNHRLKLHNTKQIMELYDTKMIGLVARHSQRTGLAARHRMAELTASRLAILVT